MVQRKGDDEKYQVRRVERLGFDDHSHDAGVLGSVVRIKHLAQTMSVKKEASGDEECGNDIDCKRQTPEAEGEVKALGCSKLYEEEGAHHCTKLIRRHCQYNERQCDVQNSASQEAQARPMTTLSGSQQFRYITVQRHSCVQVIHEPVFTI